MNAPSPILAMIDAACKPPRRTLTGKQLEACERVADRVLWNLRDFYPQVLKTRPTTWPKHLRNTIAEEARRMLRDMEETP